MSVFSHVSLEFADVSGLKRAVWTRQSVAVSIAVGHQVVLELVDTRRREWTVRACQGVRVLGLCMRGHVLLVLDNVGRLKVAL